MSGTYNGWINANETENGCKRTSPSPFTRKIFHMAILKALLKQHEEDLIKSIVHQVFHGAKRRSCYTAGVSGVDLGTDLF